MNGLSASGLADLAGTTAAEVQRLVDLGILVARDGTDPFLETDVQKVRLAAACERAGLPMEAIAVPAIRAGRPSFAFLEVRAVPAWAIRSRLTGRSARRPRSPLRPSARCWSRWGSPGWAPTSQCGRTSWRWCRC